MKVSWLGHACFLLETDQGTKIITDPYESGSYGGAIGYDPVGLEPDIVTVSHQHADHNYTREFKAARIIDEPGEISIKDVAIKGTASFHDDQQGRARGENIIFIIQAEGLTVVHFGDLGTKDIDYSKFNAADIVIIPVGGTFTLGAREATEVIAKIKPKITIPMHYKTPKLGFGIDGVERFLEGKDYSKQESLFVDPGNIQSFKAIIVLSPQR